MSTTAISYQQQQRQAAPPVAFVRASNFNSWKDERNSPPKVFKDEEHEAPHNIYETLLRPPSVSTAIDTMADASAIADAVYVLSASRAELASLYRPEDPELVMMCAEIDASLESLHKLLNITVSEAHIDANASVIPTSLTLNSSSVMNTPSSSSSSYSSASFVSTISTDTTTAEIASPGPASQVNVSDSPVASTSISNEELASRHTAALERVLKRRRFDDDYPVFLMRHITTYLIS